MGIVDLVFPKRCVGCGKGGEYICKECRRTINRPRPICPMCGGASEGGWTHSRCREEEGIERLLVGLSYKGVVQKCLKKVKYQSQWDRVDFLFKLWREKMNLKFIDQKSELSEDLIVTSVPMWRGKEKERGFNQAEILAKLLAKHYKVPYLVMLERGRETKPMFGLNKQERRKNVEGAFMLSKKRERGTEKIPRVILVDDVWTTGATMKECARVLKNRGVDSVWGVTLAR